MRLLIPLNIPRLKLISSLQTHSGKRARRILKILTRDNFRCVYCNRTKDLTMAHIKPIRRFGRRAQDYKLNNCKTLCVDCHTLVDHL